MILGLVGALQFPLYILISLFGVVPRFKIELSDPSGSISFLVMVSSLVAMFAIRLGQRLGIYIVEWKDNRENLGKLEISYAKPNGKRRTGLVVSKVVAYPNQPLIVSTGARYNPTASVGGTSASLVISFENVRRFGLGLGFDNAEEMNKVYKQLK